MGANLTDRFVQRRDAGKLTPRARPAEDYLKTGQWEGEKVWILGGGPSLDPRLICALPGKVIACNMGFEFRHDLWLVGSWTLLSRLSKVRSRVSTGIVSAYALWSNMHSMPPKGQPKAFNITDEIWGTTVAGGLPMTSNVGLTAMNVADVLGAKSIYLLGFDMRGGPDGRTINWHTHYPDSMRPPADSYGKYMRETKERAQHARAEIINCTPGSALECFEYRELAACL